MRTRRVGVAEAERAVEGATAADMLAESMDMPMRRAARLAQRMSDEEDRDKGGDEQNENRKRFKMSIGRTWQWKIWAW